MQRSSEHTAQTNFKRLLLGRVRRLTIKAHSHTTCITLLGSVNAFKRLDILTIASPEDFITHSHTVCQLAKRHADHNVQSFNCPLAIALSPRHIVYRGLGRGGLSVMFPAIKTNPTLESVTYIISTKILLTGAEQFGGLLPAWTSRVFDNTRLETDIGKSFSTCPLIRIVFEQNHLPTDDSSEEEFVVSGALDPPPRMARIRARYIPEWLFVQFMKNILRHKTRYEVCGLELAPVDDVDHLAYTVQRPAQTARIQQSIVQGRPIGKGTVDFVDWDNYASNRPSWQAPPEKRREAKFANALPPNREDYERPEPEQYWPTVEDEKFDLRFKEEYGDVWRDENDEDDDQIDEYDYNDDDEEER